MAGQKNGKRHSPPFGEWLMGAIGLLLTLGLLGYLLYEELAAEAGYPDIEVEVAEVLPNGGDFLVVLQVHNRGSETAASVIIEGEIRQGGEVLEKSRVTLGELPADSTREGGLFFARDPAKLTLEVRALGYTQP